MRPNPKIRARFVAGVAVLFGGCGGSKPLGPPLPVPDPTHPPVHAPVPAPVSIGWSFEHGLEGWTARSGSLVPSCGEVDATRLKSKSGGPVVTLDPPGNYWRTPIDIGQVGACRLDTELPRHAAVELVSPRFTIAAPYLAFRLGGGGRPGTRVELRLDDGATPHVEQGTGGLAMRGRAWNLSALRGRAAQIAIVDDGATGMGLLVDDFRDSNEPVAERPAPLWGFADLHAHPTSQLGFGKHLFFGQSDGPIAQALGSCEAAHGRDGGGGEAGYLVGPLEESPNRTLGHRTSGYPTFKGWPLYTTQVHQQMHIDWLRRAHAGGLRLLVAHAVNNEQLAHKFNGTGDLDDVHAATEQLEATSALVGRHGDFMGIARTPAEARKIIESGRLAVVLGVEVDSLGNCRRDDDCTEQQVRGEIDRLYQLGARHVFPVHLADNAFGGASVYKDQTFNLLSWYLRGTYQHVAHDDTVDFAYSLSETLPVVFSQLSLMKNLHHDPQPFAPPYKTYLHVPPGHVNDRGLTRLGNVAIEEMIRLGIVIDIDHMGQKTRADTLRVAAAHVPPAPVVMGHTRFRELGYTHAQTNDHEKLTNEAMKSATEIEAVRALGGAVAPITNQGDVRRAAGSGELTECAGSSRSWLQAYSYLAPRMGGAGVGVGTDFNGLAEEPLPRFGPSACLSRRKKGDKDDRPRHASNLDMARTLRADVDAQTAGVTYATPIRYADPIRFLGGGKFAPYSTDEVDVWIALAAWATHTTPATVDLKPRDVAVIHDLVAGFSDTTLASSSPARRAAFLVTHGLPAPGSGDGRLWYEKVGAVQRQWLQMQSGNTDAPLARSSIEVGTPPTTVTREFDINLDGLAHYGLLPDFLQDLANQLRGSGAETKDLRLVFQSAEGYIETWERAVAAATSSPPPG